MFTGIVTDIGEVQAIERRGDTLFRIATHYDTERIAIGASISSAGCCLTTIAKGDGWFSVEASAETLGCTTLGSWQTGTKINLERALKVGDELGGHIVTGHVDCVGRVSECVPEGDSLRVIFSLPSAFAKFVPAKGSIAIDGVSLTVNDVSSDSFGINLIPHTQKVTTLGMLAVGVAVNIEIDVLARYIARMTEAK